MSGENRRNSNMEQCLKNLWFGFVFFPILVCCLDFWSATCENEKGEMVGEDARMFLKPSVLNLGRNV